MVAEEPLLHPLVGGQVHKAQSLNAFAAVQHEHVPVRVLGDRNRCAAAPLDVAHALVYVLEHGLVPVVRFELNRHALEALVCQAVDPALGEGPVPKGQAQHP
jgi:hypothetical protein